MDERTSHIDSPWPCFDKIFHSGPKDSNLAKRRLQTKLDTNSNDSLGRTIGIDDPQ